MCSVTIATEIPWVNGLDVLATMAPAFRDNLGPAEGVEGLMSKYNIRQLYLDPVTTRRIDHVRADPGYVDLTCAYHDSVEECLLIGGEVTLDGEAEMKDGDYFWRPPGFVHCAWTNSGFEAILMMEGISPSDGSGPASRVVHPHEIAGTNPLVELDEEAVGPRGWVRHQPTQLLPWAPLPEEAWPNEGKLSARNLSVNVNTGAASRLVRSKNDVDLPASVSERERFIIVLKGSVDIGGEDIVSDVGLIHVPAGRELNSLHLTPGTQLMLKTGAVL
jgi:hypothetical protein